MVDTLIQFALYTIPALVVLIATYLVLSSHNRKEITLKQLELRQQQDRTIRPIRLQAYERLSLLLERVHFNNLVPRVRQSDMTAKELQYAMITAIRGEYEHNLTQQIYVSGQLWRNLVLCKDELIKIINLVAASMPTDASGNDLSRALFQHIIDSEEPLPSETVLAFLKEEVKTLF